MRKIAERRMFAKSIISSGKFLRMPPTARLLYYDLGMQADDDGVVEAYSVMAQTKATEDDLRILIAKGYVVVLNEDLAAWICDWNTNNSIRSDRYHPGLYRDLVLQFKNGDNQMTTKCLPDDNQTTTEDRIDKVRLGKSRLGKNTYTSSIQSIVDSWNSLEAYGIKAISKITSGTKRYDSLVARLKEYGEDAVLDAIENIKSSDFLQGKSKNSNGWVIYFDWFVRPNNFIKVLEGNYENRQPATPEGYVDQVTRQINEVDNWI